MAISYILNGQAAVKDVNKISKATKSSLCCKPKHLLHSKVLHYKQGGTITEESDYMIYWLMFTKKSVQESDR